MKIYTNIWSHEAPEDSNWYWSKINASKEKIKDWYIQGKYNLTEGGTYSISRNYNVILEPQTMQENVILQLGWLFLLTKERQNPRANFSKHSTKLNQ